MKTIRIDLPADLEELELYPVFDWHIGDSMSDTLLINETLRRIKETPNAFCILGGDLMDTPTCLRCSEKGFTEPIRTTAPCSM